MATNNRGGNRGGNRSRGGRNNNPEGRNQYSGFVSTARDNPLATAAAVGGAVAAGVFLWSRRNQITDQIGNLADQISEWREGMSVDSDVVSDETGGFHRKLRLGQSRQAQPDGDFRGSFDAERDGQGDGLGRSHDQLGGAPYGRPLSYRARNEAIASPSCGLVTELICVPGTSSKVACRRTLASSSAEPLSSS